MTGYESKKAMARDKLDSMEREALKLALEALEASAPWVELTNEAITNDKAIADIKEALAQTQEPAATDWTAVHEKLCEVWNRQISADEGLDEIQDLIDTTPPQRKPLTDEQLADFLGDEYHTMTAEELRYFRLAEAAHDIKE